MAASIRNVTFSVIRFQRKSMRNGCCVAAVVREKSTTKNYATGQEESVESAHDKLKTPIVGYSSDKKTILCYHPEPEFPYEHTKPLPRKLEEVQEGDSVLKVQLLREDVFRHRKDGPKPRELANIFFTTKHRWYPRPQKRYRKPNPPKDREGV